MIKRVSWKRVSSRDGSFPAPPGGIEQTLCHVADFDGDGLDEIIVGTRFKPPCLVMYGRKDGGWRKSVIDEEQLQIDAGGACFDIDGDGYLDFVAGDSDGYNLYWWKNPGPDAVPGNPWERFVIKSGIGMGHHDQIFADINHDGTMELVFWDRGVRTLFMAMIPDDPTGPWPLIPIWGQFDHTDKRLPFEGFATGDIDGDGKIELLTGGYWLKHEGNNRFSAYVIDPDVPDPRIVVGDFDGDGENEVVMSPSGHGGTIKYFDRHGDPRDAGSWKSRDLLGEPVQNAHSLAAADFNDDGNLDIFCAEMKCWSAADQKRSSFRANNPESKMIIFYGNGKGEFETDIVDSGFNHHESKIGVFTEDGGIGVCGKAFGEAEINLWLPEGGRSK